MRVMTLCPGHLAQFRRTVAERIAELTAELRAKEEYSLAPARNWQVRRGTQVRQREMQSVKRRTPIHQRGTRNLEGRAAVGQRGAEHYQHRVAEQGERSDAGEQRHE